MAAKIKVFRKINQTFIVYLPNTYQWGHAPISRWVGELLWETAVIIWWRSSQGFYHKSDCRWITLTSDWKNWMSQEPLSTKNDANKVINVLFNIICNQLFKDILRYTTTYETLQNFNFAILLKISFIGSIVFTTRTSIQVQDNYHINSCGIIVCFIG